MKQTLLTVGICACGLCFGEFAEEHGRRIETMDLTHVLPGERPVEANFSAVTDRTVPDGTRMFIGGKIAWIGFGVKTPSRVTVPLGEGATKLFTRCALDDWSKTGTVTFNILTNGSLAVSTGAMKPGDAAQEFALDLHGATECAFEAVSPEGAHVYADWFDTEFQYAAGKFPPNDVRNTSRQLGILTPPEGAAPRINGPAVVGVRPGHPLLYRLPVTGVRPLNLTLKGAPAGLTFDADRQTLTGAVAVPGDYDLTFTAGNVAGHAVRTIRLRVGDTIALTPPMGFNSWNCYTSKVTQKKMVDAAEALLKTGLADHGYSYVVVDDFWQRIGADGRAADGTILPCSNFPDMAALANDLHVRGLRAGLYSSPGRMTCGNNTGSFGHEAQDAATYAKWGFDFLKYDWCSYWDEAFGEGKWRWMHPYQLMGAALKAQDRDIVFSLCEYGNGDVSSWGAAVGGNSWRTTGDVIDSWPSVSQSIEKQKRLWIHSRPGAWNDPDMLCVGRMNWNDFKGSRLAPNEQYTHLSLWALVASPLMIGCDLTRLDDFTRSLLANDEVIAIDQDPLGAAAGCIDEGDGWEIWARPLADGSIAAGLYNKSLKERPIAFDLERLGLCGTWAVRDVWTQTDVGAVRGRYEASVPGHATQLITLAPKSDGKLKDGMSDIRDNAWTLMRQHDR